MTLPGLLLAVAQGHDGVAGPGGAAVAGGAGGNGEAGQVQGDLHRFAAVAPEQEGAGVGQAGPVLADHRVVRWTRPGPRPPAGPAGAPGARSAPGARAGSARPPPDPGSPAGPRCRPGGGAPGALPSEASRAGPAASSSTAAPRGPPILWAENTAASQSREVHGHLAPGLGAVLQADGSGHLGHRVEDSRLVVGGHLDDGGHVRRSRRAASGAWATPSGDSGRRCARPGKTAAGLFPTAMRSPQISWWRASVALEQNTSSPGRHAQAPGDDVPGLLQQVPGPLALPVDAGGVGPALHQGLRHRLHHRGQGRHRGVGIEVETLHASRIFRRDFPSQGIGCKLGSCPPPCIPRTSSPWSGTSTRP